MADTHYDGSPELGDISVGLTFGYLGLVVHHLFSFMYWPRINFTLQSSADKKDIMISTNSRRVRGLWH
eukprot:COSAG02_NODE_1835_length_10714_cov_7.585437_12_plen_68_part_00